MNEEKEEKMAKMEEEVQEMKSDDEQEEDDEADMLEDESDGELGQMFMVEELCGSCDGSSCGDPWARADPWQVCGQDELWIQKDLLL